MNKHTLKINYKDLKSLPWARFVIALAVLTLLNLLILYFFPGNIYSNIAFVITVLFIFKYLGLTGINIFFYSIIYLVVAAIIELIDDNVLLNRFSGSIAIYILSLFILATLTYLYEHKFEFKIRDNKKKIAHLSLSIFFISVFLFTTAFTNTTHIKVYFFNKFNTEKYFNEVKMLNVKGEDIANEMHLSLEIPGQYSVVNGKFKIEGWAIDESKLPGAKIDYIGIYLGNTPQDGGLPLSRCDYGIYRRDIGRLKGDEFKNSGFYCQIDSNDIEDGLKKLYIYFHSSKFGWKYETLEVFINNNNTFLFEDILDMQNKDIELKYANMYADENEIIIEEGDHVLKYIRFPVDIESSSDYMISFRIKNFSNLNSVVFFDFFGDGYDNPEQEFNLEHTLIGNDYIKINRLINTGIVPADMDIYFRIFTNSGGSLKIEDLAVQRLKKVSNE